jgi:hypothetical protein
MARKQRKRKHKTKRRQRGAGWSDATNVAPIAAGYLAHVQYPGVGKDCADNSYNRPGHLPGGLTGGLPGFQSGLQGFRGGSRKQRRRGGMLAIAPMDDSITPPPGYFPATNGAAGNMASMPNTMSSAGVPTSSGAQMAQAQPQMQQQMPQKGGRYMAGPLAPLSSNGVGTTPGALSIPCERGYVNPLNPHMRGGMTMSPAPYSGASDFSAANFPRVTVGAPDMMRYEAPNAGYRNDFETYRAPSAVGGLTMQTPYAAGSFNQACLKTGGSRRKRGGSRFVSSPAEVQPLQMSQIVTREDFDGTKGGLPVKFGGSRRKRRTKRRIHR